MKKFRKGDVIALKSTPGMIYQVTRHDGSQWRGLMHSSHRNYDSTRGANTDRSEAYLGNNPKAWKVVENRSSKKDQRIEELQGALERLNEQQAKLELSTREILDQRELDMLVAGYVSVRKLRSHTLRDVVRSYDGVSPHTIVSLNLKHPAKGADGEKYMTEFIRQLTQQ